MLPARPLLVALCILLAGCAAPAGVEAPTPTEEPAEPANPAPVEAETPDEPEGPGLPDPIPLVPEEPEPEPEPEPVAPSPPPHDPTGAPWHPAPTNHRDFSGYDETVSPWPAPASGQAYDPIRWEDPAPPVAHLIRAEAVGEWRVRVTGAPSAAPAGADLLVVDPAMGRGARATAGPDGSFEVEIASGPGAALQVVLPAGGHHGPDEPAGGVPLHTGASTYVRVPADAAEEDGSPVAATWASGQRAWRFLGAVEDLEQEVRVRGTLSVEAPDDVEPFSWELSLQAVSDASGTPVPGNSAGYLTPLVSPSGFPVDRNTQQPTAHLGGECVPERVDERTVACTLNESLSDLEALPPGAYGLHLNANPAGGGPPFGETPEDQVQIRLQVRDSGVPLMVLHRDLDAPAGLASLLFVDAPAQGARGVQPRGAANEWGWSNRIVWQPALHVTPRADATGTPIRYALEPYLPQVLFADRNLGGGEFIRLDLNRSQLEVTITDPDGNRTRLGPAPVRQLVSSTATGMDNDTANPAGGAPSGVARLATLREEFRRAFERGGMHVIEVNATLRDVHGNPYRAGGTFDVLVAEPLDLDLGTLPGTPLLVGEPVNRAVQVHPPVPASITYRLRAWAGPDATLAYDSITHGNASSFGWFHDHEHHPSTKITDPGEYRVDVFASYTEPSGKLWAAAWSFGGTIVDPEDALPLRGKHGIDDQAWDKARFSRFEENIPIGEPGFHINTPYLPGDAVWQTDNDSLVLHFNLEPTDELRDLYDRRDWNFRYAVLPPPDSNWHPPDMVQGRFDMGEAPLLSVTRDLDVSLGKPLDLAAHAYATAQRSGVRVRELVMEDAISGAYWRFNDRYTFQPGVGPEGDRPNDYKFLFGGSVLRVPSEGYAKTGGYASFWVEVPEDDDRGGRVDSPFNPDASPLLVVDGKEIHVFFEPTGVRPGSLLVEGDAADFGGYVVPLGEQAISYRITSPGGNVMNLTTKTNPWGHVHDTRLNFKVNEPGLWTVEVNVAACPPAHDADKGWPCLTGGLNTGATSYVFYVASKDAPPVPINAPVFLQRGGALSLSADGLLPGGHATAWMPGWELTGRPLGAGDPLVRYEPEKLAERFPNFEPRGWLEDVPPEQVTFTALAPTQDGKWRGVAVDAWGGRVLNPPLL